MKLKPYILDDKVVIPDYIQDMTETELDKEIERIEREELLRHQRLTAIAV